MRKVLIALLTVGSLLAACATIQQRLSGSRVSSTDPEINKAMQTAQSTLPKFIAALHSPKPSQGQFAIKARFPYGTGSQAEYLWVNDLAYADGKFQGTLDSTPQYVNNVHAGDKVTIEAPDVADWVIIDNNTLLGGFTIHAVRDRMNVADKATFDAQFQFTIPAQAALP